MLRKSNYSRKQLLEAIGRAVTAFQDATDEVDEAAATALDLNRTDMRCLSVLVRHGPMSSKHLAEAAGLTPGAMTTAIDRMESRGLVERKRDPDDRRTIYVSITAAALRKAMRVHGPIGREGARMLSKFTNAELAAILRFLEDGRDLQRAHVKRIRRMKPL
jgi:DNA-binding MarR family transcriptional regulator